jgi:hypothetical protein
MFSSLYRRKIFEKEFSPREVLGNFQLKTKSIINSYYNLMVCNKEVKLHIQCNNCVASPLFSLIIDIMLRKTPFDGSSVVQNVGETFLASVV